MGTSPTEEVCKSIGARIESRDWWFYLLYVILYIVEVVLDLMSLGLVIRWVGRAALP